MLWKIIEHFNKFQLTIKIIVKYLNEEIFTSNTDIKYTRGKLTTC